jgi:oligopeptide/dipeptide ABC transporter ATP-binding protein
VKTVKAVDGVSFHISHGEVLGVVGESGCGKSTLGRSLLRLTDISGGEIFFNGRDVSKLSQQEMRPLRRDMQIVFQDPYASLNPMKLVIDIVKEALDVSRIVAPELRRKLAAEMLDNVGIAPGQFNKYPHELSGGQRQRIAIARAVITNPSFVVCDEPVSALDASVRAQVLNLLNRLRSEMNLAYMFISHDMSVIRHISDRVMVMYLGKIVELADKKELFGAPCFPYTKVLLSAIPVPDVRKKTQRLMMEGEIESPTDPPSGCCLHRRCPYAVERCAEAEPKLSDIGGGHFVACHRIGEF